MNSLRKEAYGPDGDVARHLPLVELEARLASLPAAPTEIGRLAMILRRHPDGRRETPERVLLAPETGVPGDGWARRPPRARGYGGAGLAARISAAPPRGWKTFRARASSASS